FGDSFGEGGALVTVGHDSYARLFKIDLTGAYRPRAATGLVGPSAPTRAAAAVVALPGRARLTLASEGPMVAPADDRPSEAGFFAANPASATIAADVGRFSLVAWSGRGGAAAPAVTGQRDAFQEIASPDRLLAASWRAGRWTFTGEGAWAR